MTAPAGSPLDTDTVTSVTSVVTSEDASGRELDLDAVFKKLPHLLFLIDPDDRFADYRSGGHDIPAVPAKVFLGRRIAEVLPAATASIVLEALRRARERGAMEVVEYTLPLEGSEHHFQSRVHPLEGGRVVVEVRDVTALKLTEQSLRASDERLRRMLALSPAVVYSIRFEGGVPRPEHISENVERVLGFAPAEVLAPDFWRSRVHPDDLPQVMAMIPRMTEAGHAEAEYRIETRDHGYAWIGDEMRLERDGAGAPSLIVGAWRDVSERRRSEEAQRASEERFRALIKWSTDLVFVNDLHGRVAFLSDASAAMLGYRTEELTGKSIADLVHPDDAEFLRQQARKVRETGGPVRYTVRVLHRSGEVRILECVARNLLDEPAVCGVVVNARDVTEQVALRAQVVEARKLESVGRLAGGVAHDFNNLLTVIMSCVHFLESEVADRPEALEDVAQIKDAAARARELTSQLLAVARRRVLAPRAVSLTRIVRDAEKLLRRTVGEHITMKVVLAEELWPVRVDPTGIEHVVLNLAVNARDAMPAGGTLTIETANVHIDEGHPAARLGLTPGDWVMLAVRDSGEGMSPEVRERIFEPFFTTKATGHGTGLGLAMVHGIVKQSGGDIAVESEVGRGTTFTIHLPRTADEEDRPASEPASVLQRGHETILVVEDDASVRDLTVRTVRLAGYQVLVASGPEEALQIVASLRTPIDLLLTDVVMPKMSGRQLADLLLARFPALKVLFVSGYAENVIVHQGILKPGIDFLAKPLTPLSLLGKLRAVLDAPGGGDAK